jgi:Dickkopf N-terminal cysteine-rich region
MAASNSARASRSLRAVAWARGVVVGVGVLVVAGCHSGAAGGHNFDAAVETTPDVPKEAAPAEVYCAADAAGGGQCPLNFCGQPRSAATLPAGQMAELGADSICTPGYLCTPDVPTADGNGLQLRCVAPRAGAVAFGAACTKAGGASPCASDALCISATEAPGAPFCSRLCRADSDCPVDAYCLEQPSAKLPGGSFVTLAFCTPKAKIQAVACLREAECPADQGCVSYGPRTTLLACKKVGGTKSLGAACTGGAECRSGECYDRAFRLSAPGSRAYCSGNCKVNSDCSADQRCVRIVLGNNGTISDPRDDVVAGYCETLYVPSAAAGCKADTGCTADGADTCDTKYGLCYKKGAATGTACTADVGCDLGASCSTGGAFKNGYCQTFGCAVGATTGVDSCPGTAAICSQRPSDAPIHGCYEGCTQTADCSRGTEQYSCSAVDGPMSTMPKTICLVTQGT